METMENQQPAISSWTLSADPKGGCSMLSKFTLRRMDLLQDPFQQKNFSAKNGVCTLCAPKNLGDTLDILLTKKNDGNLENGYDYHSQHHHSQPIPNYRRQLGNDLWCLRECKPMPLKTNSLPINNEIRNMLRRWPFKERLDALANQVAHALRI